MEHKRPIPKRRRRYRCWAQAFVGLILGLFLGLLLQRVPENSDLSQLPVCSQSVTKIPLRKKHLEDPLEIIKLKEWPSQKRELVFAGVMTADKYLPTRAKAVYETWGKELPGRIAFFTSEMSQLQDGLPIVRLRGVDDSYPPQKKSFLMLQYMWENYGDLFEWFIRADDDVYVRQDRLAKFLRSVDSRQPWYIGQAGRGSQDEFGLLSLEYDENFCMGGPGVLLSRETLKRVAPHVKYCLKNLYTTHEDVEVGRCIRKFANISCTWSYEMQTILYHNSSGFEAFTGSLKQKEVHRAVTLHPVKQHQYMYRVHSYIKSRELQELLQQRVKLYRDAFRVGEVLKKEPVNDATLFGLEPTLDKFRPKVEDDVIPWDFIQRSFYSPGNLNPRRRIESPFREGIDDVIREIMEIINETSRQRGRVIDFQDILYGYYRLNPLHGPEYVLDLLLKYKKYRGKKMTVLVRRHAYLQQQFTGIEIREIETRNKDYETNSKEQQEFWKAPLQNILGSIPTEEPPETDTITFILPLSGRLNAFKRFLDNYEQVCLDNEENTTLVVVIFRGRLGVNSQTYQQALLALSMLKELKLRRPQASIRAVPVADDFARALALQIGTVNAKGLLLLIDVDIAFTRGAVQRVRLNTIEGKQAYFPIVFSQFDPKFLDVKPTSHFVLTEDIGYWRIFGFGIASMYKSDLERVGGLDTSIRGWGKEDVDLLDRFVSSNMEVFRSADPGIVHVFHTVECAADLSATQLVMCQGTRAGTLASVSKLAQIIYDQVLIDNKSKPLT